MSEAIAPGFRQSGRAVSGPLNLPFVGVAPMIRRDPTGYLQGLQRKYGSIVRFRLMGLEVYLLNEPELIRDVLVTRQSKFLRSPAVRRSKRFLGNGLLTSEGDYHLNQRRLLQPAFQRERLESYADVMASYARDTRDRFQPGVEINMWREMLRLTLAIVSRSLFDADVEAEAKMVAESMALLLRSFRQFQLPFDALFTRFPLPRTRRVNAAQHAVRTVVDRIIREHRPAVDGRGLLATLVALRYEDGGRLTDEQLREEVLSIFVAGHETPAIGLAWAWHLLAQHPEVERRLHEEVDSVLQGRLPLASDIPKLKYVEHFVAETMRLYPPIWLVGRTANEDIEIAGVPVKKGAVCVMSPWLMHHDARFFPEPERLDPDRWNEDASESRPKFSYFPFGGGTRVCIGERFAWAEMILTVATIAQKWRFTIAGEPVRPVPRITLQPSGPVRMIPVAR